MSEKDEWKVRFIDRLLALAPLGRPESWDRATLAELRRCLGKDVSYALTRIGWLFASVPDWALDVAALVAALFASHFESRGEGCLGASFRYFRDSGGSESAERRFVTLLNSEKEDLPDRLRHLVTLM